jgi:uncharacterized protein (TIGR00251 family)
MDRALRDQGDEVWLAVRAKPRGGRSALGEVIAGRGALEVRIGAPPVDGAANEELLRFLARDVLRVPVSSLALRSGAGGRDKVVAIRGLTRAEARARLERAR